jgi:hypothetical protein
MPKKEGEKPEKVARKSGEARGRGLKRGHEIALEAGRGLKKGLHKQENEE